LPPGINTAPNAGGRTLGRGAGASGPPGGARTCGLPACRARGLPAAAAARGAKRHPSGFISPRPSAATVWPSAPDLGRHRDRAGISASTLSVEISKIGSSRLTASPTFFIHRDSVPSAMDSPIWGMITSTLAMRTSPNS
jgi:hypothetical protein